MEKRYRDFNYFEDEVYSARKINIKLTMVYI